MPEMLTPTSAIMGSGLGDCVAMLTDGRFSGGSHGFIVGHIVPEALEGGPIALLADGDIVTVDASNRVVQAAVSDAEFARRKEAWSKLPPRPLPAQGYLRKFVRLVSHASAGCVTDA
jgi:dihydroxy-acid dehydratase